MLAPQHRLQVRLYDPLLQVRRGLVLGSPPSGGAHPPEPQPARTMRVVREVATYNDHLLATDTSLRGTLS